MGQRGGPPSVIDVQCSVCKRDGKLTYRTTAGCFNCGWKGEAIHSQGHPAMNYQDVCPVCGCRKVHHGD